MPRNVLLTCLFLAGFVAAPAFAADAPDFSGIWMPAANADTVLTADKLPLTDKGKAALAAFDPRRNDSTRFCLPYGTPRNVLSTAAYPIEILQRPERLTLIFDQLGDVRRIFLDGRKHPDDLWPNWLGHSIGHWDGETLVVDTVAMSQDSVLTDDGLPHSDQMHVSERLSLVGDEDGDWLEDEITISDPVMYSAPLKLVRKFRRAPHAQMSEGSGICLLNQWRRRLEQRNHVLADKAGETQPAEGGSSQ